MSTFSQRGTPIESTDSSSSMLSPSCSSIQRCTTMSVIMYRSLATRSPLYGENWKLEHTFPRVEKIGRHPRTAHLEQIETLWRRLCSIVAKPKISRRRWCARCRTRCTRFRTRVLETSQDTGFGARWRQNSLFLHGMMQDRLYVGIHRCNPFRNVPHSIETQLCWRVAGPAQ